MPTIKLIEPKVLAKKIGDHNYRYSVLRKLKDEGIVFKKFSMRQWENISVAFWLNDKPIPNHLWTHWILSDKFTYAQEVKTAVMRLFASNGYKLQRPKRHFRSLPETSRIEYIKRLSTANFLDFPFAVKCTSVEEDQIKWMRDLGWGVSLAE